MINQFKMIGRGMAGWHAKSGSCSSSGGDLDDYLSQAIEGAMLYDARFADELEFTRHVVCGPLVGCDLDPEAVDRFNDDDRAALASMAPGLGGQFVAIAKLATIPSYGGLDKVGLGIYEKLLRSIPGVRMGKVVGGKAVWERTEEQMKVGRAHRAHCKLGWI
jgi:hypothetical protein